MISLIHHIIKACAACFGLLTGTGLRARGDAMVKMETNKTGRVGNDATRLHELVVVRAFSQFMKALLLTLVYVSSSIAVTPPGTVITNTATASFGSGVPIQVNSNTVGTVSSIIATPSTVALYQFDSTSSGALGTISLPVPTQHSTTAVPPGTFVASANPSIPQVGGGTTVLDPSTSLDLLPVAAYHTGEPIFVLVNDQDQNLDPAVQETVLVTITSSTGDTEVVRLTETGSNTGEFIGYIQSTFAAISNYDGLISLGQDTNVTVTYTDQFDSSDTTALSTLVDPFGIVFDSTTGAPVDGATVAILDDLGNAAVVFGDDGVSTFPNVLTSGGTATDSSSTLYSFPTGGYRFPLLAPGNYQIVITPPVNYQAPSGVAEAALQVLPGAPYAIDADASYGNVFNLPAGPALRVDIPVDPLSTFLVLTKAASTSEAAVGDFVKYTINMENRDTTATSVVPVITDVLPVGFRYQPGSVRLAGVYVASAEPVISDGRTLMFNMANIAPASSAPELTYVAEITAAAKLGKAVNTATASDSISNTSNIATAAINVNEDLFSSTGWIAGRVYYGECGTPEDELEGLVDVKLYIEDGTSVVTDETGRFHFEGLRPGSHVVQLDTETLSDDFEIVQCEDNTRFAGTPYSQFVDIRGGSLWRTDFYVRNKPPVKDEASLKVSSELVDNDVKYQVKLGNGAISVINYRLLISLPEGLVYVPGSTTLDNVAAQDPYVNDQVLVYRLGDLGSDWEHRLNFRTRLKVVGSKDMETTTVALMDTLEQKNIRSTPVKSRVLVNAGKIESQKIVYNALFRPMSAELTEDSRVQLDDIIAGLGDVELALDKVIGYSDSVPIKNPKAKFASNEILSRARAQSVADYLQTKRNVDTSHVVVSGLGALNPIDTNKTAAGRARNRRVEIFVRMSKVIDEGGVEVINDSESVSTIEINGRPDRADKFAVTTAPEQAQHTIDMFDEFWLESATPGTEWLMPAENYSAPIPAVNIAIKHAVGAKYQVTINGEMLNPLFYFGTITNKAKTVARSYWQGIHLEQGENLFEFKVLDDAGVVHETLTRKVVYAGNAVDVEIVDAFSRLIADGTHNPVIALRFRDQDGNYARPGTSIAYDVNAPYLPLEVAETLQHNHISGMDRKQAQIMVGSYGIGIVELEPTAAAGRLEFDLKLNGESQRVDTWLQPEMRDWIMVGLVEGTLGYNSVDGNMTKFEADEHDDGFYADGRAAFYAKGRVKGEWLMTMSFDSDRGRFASDNRVHQLIDPDTYYTIYGDGTMQQHEASTSEKLYLKIEKDRFYALFGDMDTDLGENELSRYSRRMTGLKTEAEIDGFTLKGFAAEDSSRFVKQEIQGDGTSGLYRMTASNLVINSERVRIETRDRFRSDVIIDSREMNRHIDYSIDYQEGTLYFREPIASRDTSFNPIYIVIDYEVEAGVDGDITAGGRVSKRLLDDKAEIGVSVIHDATFANKKDLIGVDAEVELDEATTLRAEVATTDGESTGVSVKGDAYLAEIEHDTGALQGRAYVKKQESGYGLGQLSGTESGTSKYGVEGEYLMNKEVLVDAEMYHEENLTTSAERDVVSANVTYNQNKYTLSAGARMARDQDGTGADKDSDLLLLGASRKLLGSDLLLRGNAEVALGDNANPDYPSRYILGADYAVSSKINLFAENEWTDGQDQDTQISRMGLRSTPWAGATASTSVNREIQENGIRSFATLGLTQGFDIDERWSGDVTFDRSETLRHPGAVPFNTNVTPAQGTNSDDFTAVSLGTTYKADLYTVAGRLEQRNAEQEHKTGALLRWERDIIDGIAYSLSTELFDVDRTNGTASRDTDVRFSLGYRPDASEWIVLNKLEYKQDKELDATGSKTTERKFIENIVANYKPDHENQLSLNYGVKFVANDFDGAEFDGVTQLLGTEYRHDLSRNTDYGLHLFNHYSVNSGLYQYSLGASFGWNLARNVWISFGYNFEGFEDSDFSSAGYTAYGPYMKFRMKFDQDTAKEVQRWLN